MRPEDMGKSQEQIIDEMRSKLDSLGDITKLESRVAALETEIKNLIKG